MADRTLAKKSLVLDEEELKAWASTGRYRSNSEAVRATALASIWALRRCSSLRSSSDLVKFVTQAPHPL
jgi:hypothetical protein